MKKNTFLHLVLISFIISACTPKYGAHFQASTNHYEPSKKNPESLTNESVKLQSEVILQKQQILQLARWTEVTASSEPTVVSPLTPMIERHNEKIKALEESNIARKGVEIAIRKSHKDFKKDLKNEIKKARRANDDQYVLMMILGILIAPLGVGLTYGIGPEFWISLILFLLFWLPGAIYGGIKVHQFFRG